MSLTNKKMISKFIFKKFFRIKNKKIIMEVSPQSLAALGFLLQVAFKNVNKYKSI